MKILKLIFNKKKNYSYFKKLLCFQTALERTELNEILPLTETSARTGTALCSEMSVFQSFCINLFFQISGYDLDQFNTVKKYNIKFIKLI